MEWQEVFQGHVCNLTEWWVNQTDCLDQILTADEQARMLRKNKTLQERNAEVEKTAMRVNLIKAENKREDRVIHYRLHSQWLIRQEGQFYLEEKLETRQAVLRGNNVVSDRLNAALQPVRAAEPFIISNDPSDGIRSKQRNYDRLNAVRYAELWWNRRNPVFPKVENDCTNFISQCLFAGHIPMWGQPVRGRGWWYERTNWSFSWAVANNLRWYLSRHGNVIGAVEVDSAEKLVPGDVICYDFEGDGHWNHNTMVTALDPSGWPLVNAHTYDARSRSWSYTDSPAWTDKIQYKFFHIEDEA
ncbi:amidase domain-containing protein [Sporolactobacillus pectinivorans]|uniref:amidase domain-containing protein n=1 Tax=Sporolactobacillus pectinivorans TaxID=1591408 RepID=UPI000C25D598|nr:amidase domain-containing protein [Sporolactobacillus pectinivorans]